jgi:hypothetical protein
MRHQHVARLQMDLTGVKAFHGAQALLLSGCLLTLSPFGHAASDPDKPCGIGMAEPPPAYPLPARTARDIAAMFAPPRTAAELLSNLKIVLDEQLLAQPAFFEDEVLHILFNTIDVHWVKPGTPDVVSERFIDATRIARVRFDAGGSFAGMKVDVGVNRKCLNRRPHPSRPDTFIPAHTYDSGYIRIRLDGPATLTAGDVRQAFGWSFGGFPSECRSPLSMHYPGPEGPSRDAFRIHAANFGPSVTGYAELCRTALNRGVPDPHPISDIWMRLIQEDYARPEAITP